MDHTRRPGVVGIERLPWLCTILGDAFCWRLRDASDAVIVRARRGGTDTVWIVPGTWRDDAGRAAPRDRLAA